MNDIDNQLFRSILQNELTDFPDAVRSQLSSLIPTKLSLDSLRGVMQEQLAALEPDLREDAAGRIAERVCALLSQACIPPLPDLSAQEGARMQRHLREMNENGVSLLGQVLSAEQVREVRVALAEKKVYASHVWSYGDRIARSLDEVRKTHKQASYQLSDVLDAPHLLEAMSSPFVLKLAERYLDCTPTLFQANAMWSFPQNQNVPSVAQSFHRDWDNFRFCVLFVYLSDVDDKNGAHQYIRKTHRLKGMQDAIDRYREKGGRYPWVRPEAFYHEGSGLGWRYNADVFSGDVEQIEAPGGYAFLVDAFGLHRGLPLMQGDRLLFWSRYSLYDNGFSRDVTPHPLSWDHYRNRLPDDATNRYIFRSVLASEYTPPSLLPEPAQPPSPPELMPSFDEQCDALIQRYGKRAFVGKAAKLTLKHARDWVSARR